MDVGLGAEDAQRELLLPHLEGEDPTVFFSRIATCEAMLSAKLVLPMPGRPPMMISVPLPRPWVMLVVVDEPGRHAGEGGARVLLEHLEGLFDDAVERHEAPPDRLLAERHDRRLGVVERLLRVDAAVEAVAGDIAADVDQPPPDRALLDDLDVVLEAPEVRQIDVEAGEVGEPAGALERRLLLELRLHGAQVDRRPGSPAGRASWRRSAGGARRGNPPP